jgi:hypothetical protein
MAMAVMQPLTRREEMRRRDGEGRSNEHKANGFIKRNDRMTSFERLEIYNRQYWFRLFASFTEDFPGLQAIIGSTRFHKLMRAYLEACPSTSFSLRNLGSRLGQWLQENPEWAAPDSELAQQMVALEWAHIESFDSAALPILAKEALAAIDAESKLALQPHLRLVSAGYPVDDILIKVRSESGSNNSSSNNASRSHRARALRALPRIKTYIAAHRHQDTVYYRRLSVEGFVFLEALQNGENLGSAIEIAFLASSTPEAEKPEHLQKIVQDCAASGWFCELPHPANPS